MLLGSNWLSWRSCNGCGSISEQDFIYTSMLLKFKFDASPACHFVLGVKVKYNGSDCVVTLTMY